MNAAIDVGADDGFHGILYAFLNPKIKVFSFEPIKGSKKIILLNLKKIENYFGIKIKNFKIINSAISNFNGTRIFYETNYKVASSLLKPKKKLSKKWIKSKDILLKEVSKGFKIKKKYKVKVLTLEKFCKQNKIKVINYIKVDAQGNDLNVIKSLKKYRKNVVEGVIEVSENKKQNIYEQEKSYDQIKSIFNNWKFEITNFENVQKNMPYLNVYFKNTDKQFDEYNKIMFNYPSKRLKRIFKRIFLNKANFKDLLFKYFWIIKTKVA